VRSMCARDRAHAYMCAYLCVCVCVCVSVSVSVSVSLSLSLSRALSLSLIFFPSLVAFSRFVCLSCVLSLVLFL